MRLPVYILGTLSAMLTIAGVLFKIQHWPGAGVGLTFGLGLAIIFIPIYAIYRYNKAK